MVNVNVSVPPDSNLLLDTFIAGKIVLASSQGWIVPRGAVVPRADGSNVIFTVSDGAAKEHAVELGLENDQESQIKAAGLSEGDPVVIVNNSILEDGMKVEARSSATQPSEEPP